MRKRVLWVGRGRGREDVRPFFALLGPERCAKLRAAVMDMNAGYELEVRQHCKRAVFVFDLFHVIAKYGREVIDRVRVDRANETNCWPPTTPCSSSTCSETPSRTMELPSPWLRCQGMAQLVPHQVIKRMAYGFRDDAYFFLKIRAAYPGVGR